MMHMSRQEYEQLPVKKAAALILRYLKKAGGQAHSCDLLSRVIAEHKITASTFIEAEWRLKDEGKIIEPFKHILKVVQ